MRRAIVPTGRMRIARRFNAGVAYPQFFQAPEGRQIIAHRFIGGLRIGIGLSPGRDGRTSLCRRTFSFAPPGLWEFWGTLTRR
jgi:hypothetical protein